jgi:hypothetical protein
MATITTLVDGDLAVVAPVNANFVALNTEIASAQRTGYSTSVAVGNITTGEDVLHTYTMPANTLTAAGDGYVVRSLVQFAANANTKALKFYHGGVSVPGRDLNPTTTAPNNAFASITIHAMYTGSNSLSFWADMNLADVVEASPAALIGATHLPGSAIQICFTGAATATNDIVQRLTTIFLFKAP